jgi:flagellar biosynthesis protein FliR
VIPAEFAGIEHQLIVWLLAMIRPGAAFLAAPVFGAPQVPVQLRLILALAIGVPAAQISGLTLPEQGIISFVSVKLIIGEVLIGLALGFVVQMGFAASVLAGEVVSNAMGIGFAAMNDPISGSPSPAIGQLFSMLATFLFLASNGHLILIQTIVESYVALRPGGEGISFASIGEIADFGGMVFASGVAIALPVAFAMVLVQIIMAMIARSAPSLNLFAVGMPAALLAGIALLAMGAPVIADGIMMALDQGLDQAQRVARG